MLGILLDKLAEIPGNCTAIKTDESEAAIVYESFDLTKDIYFTYYQIVHYGKKDISVVLSLFNALETISIKATVDKQLLVNEFAEYVYSTCISEYRHPIDIKLIRDKRDGIVEN
jgi:phosphoribosyl-ATP pyrophosphohydrolase